MTFETLITGNICHEIRTPMNSIMGVTQLLRQTELTSQQEHYIQILERSSHTLLQFIDNTLDFFKLSTHRIEKNECIFNLKNTINDINNIMEYKIIEKKLQYTCYYETNIPDILIGDENKIKQIIINLLQNAVKFTEKGSIQLHVNLKKECEDSVILSFSVIDTGIGIPCSLQGDIFNMFVQGNSRHKNEGLGLGLSICKHLVELINAQIDLISEEGIGSTFMVTIPLGKTAYQDDFFIDQHLCRRSDIDTKLRILSIEDNIFNQEVIKGFFKNHEPTTARTGNEALNILDDHMFDLILLDIHLPDMNGFELTKLIRSSNSINFPKHNIPIIGTSSDTQKGVREKCLDAGMTD
ncbi:MAG: response regulator, partial [Desulfobacterales bacterium]|nr:response regulator [Desulfobacterales bacterium]